MVNDQIGRLTFTDEMAKAEFWLLGYRDGSEIPLEPAAFSTYNVTGSGDSTSWAEIARLVFEYAHGNGDAVQPVSTAEYYVSAAGSVAPRPMYSTLSLEKIEAAGFAPKDWRMLLSARLSLGQSQRP